MMHPALDHFCAEIGGDIGAQLRAAIAATETEAVNNVNAQRFLNAIRWIAGQDRSVAEKVEALAKLIATGRGCHVMIPSARKFFGWDAESAKVTVKKH
jgi:hypothetical protein